MSGWWSDRFPCVPPGAPPSASGLTDCCVCRQEPPPSGPQRWQRHQLWRQLGPLQPPVQEPPTRVWIRVRSEWRQQKTPQPTTQVRLGVTDEQLDFTSDLSFLSSLMYSPSHDALFNLGLVETSDMHGADIEPPHAIRTIGPVFPLESFSGKGGIVYFRNAIDHNYLIKIGIEVLRHWWTFHLT